jgi:meiotic recombination protein SPO11
MPPTSKGKRPVAATAVDPAAAAATMAPVKKLRSQMGSSASSKKTLEEVGVKGVFKEVKGMERQEVRANIESLCLQAVASIMRGEGFSYTMPARTATNMLYVPELDRLVLKDKMLQRVFASASSARKTAITTRILQLVLELCGKGIHVTKRDLFYTDVKLFKQQTESDDVLDDVACMVGCTRSSLNVVASEKGVVVGRLIFDDDGDTIDCTKMGVGGKAIPPTADRVSNMRGDAEFILLIEKDAAFMRLAEDRFYNTYPCVIISGKGQPDVATRLFLNKVARPPPTSADLRRPPPTSADLRSPVDLRGPPASSHLPRDLLCDLPHPRCAPRSTSPSSAFSTPTRTASRSSRST